jgi:hypothetical protein
MKSAAFVFTFFFTLNSLAGACPFNTAPATYTEASIPCSGMEPDLSQAVAINQATADGGECRVESVQGESYKIIGKDLFRARGTEIIQHLGVLIHTPFCFQRDTDDEYYSSWNAVKLDGSK